MFKPICFLNYLFINIPYICMCKICQKRFVFLRFKIETLELYFEKTLLNKVYWLVIQIPSSLQNKFSKTN